MNTVYNKFDKHFAQASAWVIVNEQGDQVGKMAAKYPKDSMGKLYLYLHLYGSERVQVSVSGCGFDKLSMAIQKAGDGYVKKNLGKLTKAEECDFLQALCNVNHDFSSWNNYGTYKFLQAV